MFTEVRKITKSFGKVVKCPMPCFQEKLLSIRIVVPVPTTNTRDQKENFQASEITTFKELGKITPYVRKKGCFLEEKSQRNGPGDCLTKTQVPAKQ